MKEIQGKQILDTLEEIVDPKHTALLIIDVQNDNASPKGFVGSRGGDITWPREVVSHIQVVLEEARRLGITIFFMKMLRFKDPSFEPNTRLRLLDRTAGRWKEHIKGKVEEPEFPIYTEGTWGGEVLDELNPRPDERQITKYLSSSFIGTHLDFMLRNAGIKAAVVTGFVTEGCVETTVRDLEQFGYFPVILRDCVGSSNRTLHDAALVVMTARYDVVTSDELLKVWRPLKSKAKAGARR